MQDNYVIIADDNCDLPYEFYSQNDIAMIKMPYCIDDNVYRAGDMPLSEFYKLIREGKRSTTMALNSEEIKTEMEKHLKDGKNVLYLAFSSGLSATYESGARAAGELSKEYPDRKIKAVDSLCASMGEGLFLFMAHRKKQEGASFDELVEWAENNRLNVAHYFTVDDLMHLHRGGRVSKTSAIAGSMLGIKPVLYVDNDGKLIPIGKVRGRKQALASLVDNMEKVVGGTKPDYFMISHADCADDAEYVAGLMKKRFGIKDCMINFIGPVVGSHTGVGTVALFMMAEHR